ncbi:MAG TPA: prolyl oligopeptidase family serine peptidase [Fimbriimonadaceae bacterium]|nr:prolyl oligopeptidase family serine peptidase [Fimbriimonadaceae bacterium]HRJ33031.1 prolyl oligopeptidase family serine peptidase [Fimbriimonadaceae bacterium]
MLATLYALSVLASAQAAPPATPATTATFPTPMPLKTLRGELTLEDLFPRKSYFGKTARGMEFSFDDRYVAYLWNPYDDRGFDLYVLDRRTGKSERVTSLDVMATFDRRIAAMKEQIQKDNEEEKKMLQMNDLEYREFMIKRRTDTSRRNAPPPYPGISEVAWAHKSHDLIFGYAGDLFRWKPGGKIERLTRTRDSESAVEWLPDDSGFYVFRDGGLFRMRFSSGVLEQLDPELPDGHRLGTYDVSPDGRWMMVRAWRATGQYRQVEWITYRNRFAEVRRSAQYWGFPDDKVQEESVLWLYDLNDDPAVNPKHDGKPWELWRWKSGTDILDVSIHTQPWSADGKKFVYSSSSQRNKTIDLHVVDLEKKAQETVYKSRSDGEPSSADFCRPFFAPDGQSVVAMLEQGGFRNAWQINLTLKTATPLTAGDFESYPLAMTPDSQNLLVASQRDSMARLNVYRVNLQNGGWTRLTEIVGNWSMPTVSPSTQSFATTMIAWDRRPELFVQGTSTPEKAAPITQSHRDGFEKIQKLKPQLFSFKNRHGQTVHGFKFLPKDHKKGQKRPLLLYVYGGPLASPMAKTINDGNFGSSEYRFHMFLAHELGYVTAAIDPRGQTGLGAEFGRANFEQAGKPQVEDLSDAVFYLEKEVGVDRNRVGIHGWSFGGFQTMMCMFTAPDVFKLGMAGAGPTEWQNYNAGYTEMVIGEAREGKPEDLDKFSLTHLAKNLQGDLMLMHGMEDDNVLFQHAIAVYRKLLQYGKGPLVEFVVDPTGGHGMGGDMDTRDRHAIYLSYLMRKWGVWKP